MLLKNITKLLLLLPLFLHALNRPDNLQLTPSHNSVTLTWQDTNSNETGYKIFRNGILVAVTNSNVENFIDHDLLSNTFYRYSVKATDEDGDILHAKKKKIVFGYYHFHEMNTTTDAQTNWANFTHIGWHFIKLTSDMPAEYTLVDEDAHIWPTTEDGEGGGLHDPLLVDVKKRLDMFHDNGIKVYLGVMADKNITKELLGTKAWRSTAINAIIKAMLRGGADGLDIDIENQAVDINESDVVDAQEKLENLYNFLKELRVELDRRELYDKAVHIAAPVHFGYLNAYANSPVKKILNIVDSYFVMGYDIKWTPNASSHSLFRWSETYAAQEATYASDYGWSDIRAIAALTRGTDLRLRSKIILGVPYYSYEYLTDSGDFAAEKIQGFIDPDDENTTMHAWAGKDISYTHIAEIIQARNLIRHVDAGTDTNWISWQDDTNNSLWHQVYYEDTDSLATKYRFANEQGLGGAGMWSIGSHQSTAFDTLLHENFHTDIVYRNGSKKKPIVINVPFHDTQDTTEGTSYFNFYAGACDINKAMYGFEYVYEIDIPQRGSLNITLTPDEASTKLSIQILDDLKEVSCLAQSDTTLAKVLNTGKYYIVIDTKVVNMVDKRGSYSVDVDFTPK